MKRHYRRAFVGLLDFPADVCGFILRGGLELAGGLSGAGARGPVGSRRLASPTAPAAPPRRQLGGQRVAVGVERVDMSPDRLGVGPLVRIETLRGLDQPVPLLG